MGILKEEALLTPEEKVHFRKRTFDCPALEICTGLGTALQSCHKGGKEHRSHGKCLPSIVLLLSQLVARGGEAGAAS